MREKMNCERANMSEYTIHPAANAFPMMDNARYKELLEDIRVNGLRKAITISDGAILDGRNRYKACCELGITPTVSTFEGNPWAYVWSLNGLRRDLNDMQRAAIKLNCDRNSDEYEAKLREQTQRIEQERKSKISDAATEQHKVSKPYQGEKMDVGPKDPHPSIDRHKGRAERAAAAHVGTATQKKVETIANNRPDLLEKVALGEMKGMEALREIKQEKQQKELEEAQVKVTEEMKTKLDSVCDLRVCSCGDLFASGIKPDAVITDPPYPELYLPVFSELAEGCKKAGVPLVAVMSGQTYLPEVMARLCEHLQYRWTLAYMTPGASCRIWPVKIQSNWKPILLFGEPVTTIFDVFKSDAIDKRFHGWGQSESGMADLVERLTKPGQLICDPFLGGGTTAVVALKLGRRFVGCDLDCESINKTRARLCL